MHFDLGPVTVQRTLTECVMAFRQFIVLSGIGGLKTGFRVRSHDMHESLSEIVVENSGNIFAG